MPYVSILVFKGVLEPFITHRNMVLLAVALHFSPNLSALSRGTH